jgi:hypothetical protein
LKTPGAVLAALDPPIASKMAWDRQVSYHPGVPGRWENNLALDDEDDRRKEERVRITTGSSEL